MEDFTITLEKFSVSFSVPRGLDIDITTVLSYTEKLNTLTDQEVVEYLASLGCIDISIL
jgi:hypothetical protein